MPKVVVHIHALGLGGAERVTLDWLRWLHDEGHQIWLLLGTSSQPEFFTAPAGITVWSHESIRGRRSSTNTALWLRECLRSIQPDLVIGMTTRPAINVLLASVGCSWPVVVAERNFPPAKRLPLAWQLLRALLYPKAALHLVQTERIGSWLCSHGLARQVSCIPNAVHWPLIRQAPWIQPEDCLPKGASLLMGVGTKPKQKGFDRLLLAFAHLAPEHPNWWLALPGLEPDDPWLKLMLAQCPHPESWQSRLLMPGRVGNLADWYARADLFALTSRYEGFPNVLLEAMAARCACLAIDCPTGPRELINHRVNGWLVNETTSETCQQQELEQALIQFMDDEHLRLQCGRAASTVRSSLEESVVKQSFLQSIAMLMQPKVLLFAPSRRSPTETFVRANLAKMPFRQTAFFGDEFGPSPGQFLYGCSVLISKGCTRLGFQRLATIPPSMVAWGLIQFYRPNVVMAEFGFHAVRMMNAIRWTGIPFVVHFRGSDASADRRLRCLAERYRCLMCIASEFIVKSRPMQCVLEGFGASAARITISPSGANQDLFRDADPAAAAPIVLFVGRLIEKKGPLDALEAFARVIQRTTTPIRFLIIGEGPLRSVLLARIQQLGLEDQVELLGLRTPSQIAVLMRQVRCLILPSRIAADGDSEGCPVVVLEAQMAGLPVISTRHAGIPEVVIENQTAFLAEEGDVESLAIGLERLVSDPKLAGRMGKAASLHAKDRFTVNHHIAAVASVVHRLVEPKPFNS